MADVVGTIAITGADGNVGRKLVSCFLSDDRCERIYAIDKYWRGGRGSNFDNPKVVAIESDLLSITGEWRRAVQNADAIVHLAAQNPHTDASWVDATASMEMTANLVSLAAQGKTKRFIFASTNHVMGGYKSGCDFSSSGWLSVNLEPKPGTKWHNGTHLVDSTIYATSKLMCEHLLKSVASTSNLLAVSVRIGWVQPNANEPDTLSIAGDAKYDNGVSARTDEDHLTQHWFRCMWLSNRDLHALFRGALWYPSEKWDSNMIVVNGMSANKGMPWDISATSELLGYVAQDDCFMHLAPHASFISKGAGQLPIPA